MHSFQFLLKISNWRGKYGLITPIQQIVWEKISARGQPERA